MDREFIKFIITPISKNDTRLIQEGDFIDSDLVDILCSTNISCMKNAFAPIRNQYKKDEYPYKIELCCPKCGETFIRSLSKSRLMETLRIINLSRKEEGTKNEDNLYEFLWCNKCIKDEQERRDQENRKSHVLYMERQEEKLNDYIGSYINPDCTFKAKLSGKDRERAIMNEFTYFSDHVNGKIKSAVRSLSYSDFLKTPYWDGVRNYKLRRSGYKCELCASNESLNVHHKTYERHGLEHLRSVADNDLIVLCKSCHYKFHDKLEVGK